MSDTWKRQAGPDLISALDFLVEAIAERVAERVIDELGGNRPSVERVGLGPSEVAEALGMSASTVRERIKDGTIRAGQIGGRIIVHRRELDRLLLGEEAS